MPKITHKIKNIIGVSFILIMMYLCYRSYLSLGNELEGRNQYLITVSLLILSNIIFLYSLHRKRRLIFFLEGSLDALEMPITTTDMKMRWVFINKVTETLLAQRNLDKRSVIGKHCSNWKADICETENCGVTCLRSGKPRTHYNQEMPGEQPSLYMRVDTHYISDDGGNKIGHVEVVSNVDALKQLKKRG